MGDAGGQGGEGEGEEGNRQEQPVQAGMSAESARVRDGLSGCTEETLLPSGGYQLRIRIGEEGAERIVPPTP